MPEELNEFNWLISCLGFSLFCLVLFIITVIVSKSYVKKPTSGKYSAAGVLNGFSIFFFVVHCFIFLISIIMIFATIIAVSNTISEKIEADFASLDSIIIYIADVLPIITFCFGIKAMAAHSAAVRLFRLNHPLPVQMPGYMSYTPMPNNRYYPQNGGAMPNVPMQNGYPPQNGYPAPNNVPPQTHFTTEIQNTQPNIPPRQAEPTAPQASESKTDSTAKCPYCGAVNSEANKFCIFCGKQIKG